MEQRILTPLQQKFITKLLPYDFEVQYKRGRENAAADALSWIPDGHITLQAAFTITSPLIQEIKDSVTHDPHLQKIIQEKIVMVPATHSILSLVKDYTGRVNEL